MPKFHSNPQFFWAGVFFSPHLWTPHLCHTARIKKDRRKEMFTPLFKLFLEPRNPHLPALGFWMYLYRTGHISIFGQICWGKSRFLHFLRFLRFFTYFHSALPNMAVFECFRPIFGIKNDHQHHGDGYGSILICNFFDFCTFWVFLGIFLLFWGFSGG